MVLSSAEPQQFGGRLLTIADTVRAPLPWRRQLWGVWRMTASEMGYPFPLLSKSVVLPLVMVITTVKDEMP